jgi:hypothetical protein
MAEGSALSVITCFSCSMPIAYGTLAPAMVRNRASTFYSDRWDSLVESLASIRSGIGVVLLLVAALYLVHKSRLRPMSAGGVNFASQSRPSNKCRRNIHDVRIQAYPRPDGVVASRWSCAIALVKVMRIPCFGCRITLGRASIV